MNKHIFGAVGLSALLLLGPTPAIVLAHEGHDHGAHHRSGYSEPEGSRGYEPQGEEERSRYRGEQEESGRYDPQREDDRWNDDAYDEDEEDEADRPAARRYPPPDREQSSPREWQGKPR